MTASRRIEDLAPEVQALCRSHVEGCRIVGVDLLVYCTLRPLKEQARLFRVNRSRPQVEAKIEAMRRSGYSHLAEIISDVGPQPNEVGGRIKTNAGPGESWHYYGQAYDCAPVVNGKLVWDETHPAWRQARKVGLQVGLRQLSWEMVHFQPAEIPVTPPKHTITRLEERLAAGEISNG